MSGIKKSLVFQKYFKNHIFVNRKLIKNDPIIALHVNTEVLTSGEVITSGTKLCTTDYKYH